MSDSSNSVIRKVALQCLELSRQRPRQPVRHLFTHGLKVAVIVDGAVIKLGAWRVGVEPSKTELAVLRKAFGIADGVIAHPKLYRDAEKKLWKGFVLVWERQAEASQAKLE